jgi:hypothetical protein
VVRYGTSHISDDRCDKINLLVFDCQRDYDVSVVAILTAKLLGAYDVGNKGFRLAHVKQYLLIHRCLIFIVTCYVLFL